MHRKPFICGNWKMHKNRKETIDFFQGLHKATQGTTDRDILIAPCSVYLSTVIDASPDSNIIVCSQNVHYMNEGAYTGELSPKQLKDINCSWSLVGHSERRQYFLETDEIVNLKTRACILNGIKPIVCIGETAAERKAGRTQDVLSRSLKVAFHMVSEKEAENITIAYEPVWAIGTGLTATPEMAQEAHKFIRDSIITLYSKGFADKIRLLYGGSVKPDNVKALINMEDIDGALVGGASLSMESFIKIINFDKD